MSESSSTRPLLEAEGLAVRAGSRRLLAPCNLALHEGERVLVVGPSGSGKSLFCDLVLGFAGPETPGLDVEGSLRLEGRELLGADPESRDAQVGAVFQLHALGLFDDLTVDQNLYFGSEDAEQRGAAAAALGLSDLDRRVAACSGGERVRVGIVRTLLRGAGVLLYDEPTTGLDPASSRQVVEAIAASHRRLSIVVTHDYAAFASWADVVVFLDPGSRTLERLPGDEASLARVAASIERASPPIPEESAPRPTFRQRLRTGWKRAALATSRLLEQFAVVFLAPFMLARIAHPEDGPRVRGALRRDLAPAVASFVGLAAILVAFTGTWFLFDRLPERDYSEPLIQEDILAGLGLIFTRVGMPLMASVLLAAKLGAAASAQLGHMSLTRQVDALQLLRVPLWRHLLLPTALGQLVSALVFTTLSMALAYGTALVVFLGTHPGWSARYFHRAYLTEVAWGDLGWIAAKVGVSALGVALVAFRIGTETKRVPEQVVKGIHRTLLAALLLVLAVHATFAFLEF